MDSKKILEKLREKFDSTKEELGFKSSFEDVDKIFFISDLVLQEKYVSESFSRQLSHRIVDLYNSWLNYLHSLIMPNPSNIINMLEAKMLNDDEKKKVSEIIKKTLGLISKNSLNGLTRKKELEAEFIDEAVKFWDEYFKSEIINIAEKISKEWNTESES